MMEIAIPTVGLATILATTAIVGAFILGWMLCASADRVGDWWVAFDDREREQAKRILDEELEAINIPRDPMLFRRNLTLEEAAQICEREENDCQGLCAKAIRKAKGNT